MVLTSNGVNCIDRAYSNLVSRLASERVKTESNLRLVPVSKCPLCGSVRRQLASKNIMNTKPDSYTERFADYVGTPHDQLVADARQFVCEDCGTVYLDPYFTDASQAQLYQLASPTHISGWTEWEIAARTGQGRPHMLQLATQLEAHHGPVGHYVEVACPFSGMLLATAEPTILRSWKPSSAVSVKPDWRMTRMARLHSGLERLMLRAVDVVLALRRISGKSAQPVGKGSRPLSGRRTLALSPSLRRWNLGCSRYGSSCGQVAMQTLDCEVALLSDLPSDSADMIGIFNSLDHVQDPLDVLLKCLTIAPRVVVGGHEPNRAKYQHPFALDAETLRRLGTKNSFIVTDFVKTISDWPRSEYLVMLTRA